VELEGSFKAPRPDIQSMSDDLANQTIAIYRSLVANRAPEGNESLSRLRPAHWDLRVEGILVEVDEERHFNRYRKQALQASAYEQLSAFPLAAYRAFCVEHEADCLAAAGYGGYWSNKSCEAMFGEPGKERDLSGNGAPRWRQRAFYDYLKDLAPLCGIGPMVRLAVCDELPDAGGRILGEILDNEAGDEVIARAVMRLVHQRVTPL
jgi:hypothetical protein